MNHESPLNAIDQKKLDTAVCRAKEMLHKADVANKAQYTHGINSDSSDLRYWLRKISERPARDWEEALQWINYIHPLTMKIGGYLYCLRESI